MRVPGPFMSVTAANLPWGGSGTSNGALGSLWAGSGGLWPLEYTNQRPEPPPTACQLVIAPDSKSSMTIVLGRAWHPTRTELSATSTASAAATALLRPLTPRRAPRCWIGFTGIWLTLVPPPIVLLGRGRSSTTPTGDGL